FPVELVRFELVPDSGGPGRYRGGLSYVREYRMHGAGQFSTRDGDRLTPPLGRGGGAPGSSGATIVNPGTPDEHRVTARDGNVRLKAGDVLRREMAGAGGYGNPLERDLDAVLEDVNNRYVSPQAARESYGVVVVPRGRGWVIDHPATQALRSDRTMQS
ncbi:MAG: hydantoinase B/oxoprolinase family protein, partial [Actinobacteria bacterium]|nr:hydantoinase B/oxoprolinase family protein [Actinomycetota bacterium]